MAARLGAAALIISLAMLVASKSINETSNKDFSALGSVILAIEKVLHYYTKNIRNLNLDGFFGLRVVEGHLLHILEEYKAGQHKDIPENIWVNITRLAKTAAFVSAKGLQFVRSDNPKYFDDFSSIVKSPWAVFKPQQKLEPHMRWEIPQYKAKLKTRLSEELSDRCLKELMVATSSECNISAKCVTVMTTRGLTGYSITHQVLWSILAEMSAGCNKKIVTKLKMHKIESLEKMQLEMCTNNFYEMVAVVHVLMKGQVHESHQDLFLEQQFVCPSLGFYEFLKNDYLDQILAWQFPSGCFGEEDEEPDEEYVDFGDLLQFYHNKHQDPSDQDADEDNDVKVINNSGSKNSVLQQNDGNSVGIHHKKNGRQRMIDSDAGVHIKSGIQILPPSGKPVFDHKSNVKHLQSKNSMTAHSVEIIGKKSPVDTTKQKKQRASLISSEIFSKQKNILHRLPKSIKGSVSASESWAKSQSKRHGRKLLVEKQLTGGCLSHKTGVGAGALVIYLRYLIQPGNITWDDPHELFGFEGSNDHIQDDRDGKRVGISGHDRSGEDVNYEDKLDLKEEEAEENNNLKSDNHDYDENAVLGHGDSDKGKEDTYFNTQDDRNDIDDLNMINVNESDELSKELYSIEQGGDGNQYYDYDDNGDRGSSTELISRVTSQSVSDKDKKSFKTFKSKRQPYKNNSHFTLSYVMYGEEEGETFTTSHPGTLLVVLVSVSPILIVMFFLCQVFRCNRLNFNYHV